MKKSTKQHFATKLPILGGKCHIYRSPRSGDVWQYLQYVPTEKKYIRVSLKTIDRQFATELAEKKFANTLGRIHSGEKIFSLTAQEFVDRYLEYLQKRVGIGSIRKSFFTNRRYHLNLYLKFVGSDTRILSIPAEKFRDFVDYRRSQPTQPGFTNILDTQTAISTLYRWGLEEQLLTQKYLPKWSEIRVPQSEGKRHGMEIGDYNNIVSVSKNWDRHGKSEKDKYERRHLHHFVMIQSWYGLRTGELLGLTWGDVRFLQDKTVRIRIREETTKRGKGRDVVGRGDVFERIRSYSKFTSPTDYVFSPVSSGRKWYFTEFYIKWRELVSEVTKKHPTFDNKKSLYDLRHFYISSRLRAGDSPWLIAKYCGTSAEMIAKHYDNVTDEQVSKKILSKTLKFVGDDVIGITNNKKGEPQ